MLSAVQIKKMKAEMKKEDGKLPMVFAALSDFGRFRMFKILMRHRDVCVTDVSRIFDISVPAASQQLKILEMTGLAKRERMGQMTCYMVNRENPVAASIARYFHTYNN